VFQAVDGIELASNVIFTSRVVKVFHSWVLLISAKNLLGLLLPGKY